MLVSVVVKLSMKNSDGGTSYLCINTPSRLSEFNESNCCMSLNRY